MCHGPSENVTLVDGSEIGHKDFFRSILTIHKYVLTIDETAKARLHENPWFDPVPYIIRVFRQQLRASDIVVWKNEENLTKRSISTRIREKTVNYMLMALAQEILLKYY